MAEDDLNQPLHGKAPKSGGKTRPFISTGLISLTALLILLAGVWIAVVDDPLGGQPVAVAAIQDPAPAITGSLGTKPSAPKATSTPGSIQVAGLPILPPPLSAAAPPADMIEQSAFGPLPRISPDGLKPMDAYRGEPRVPPAAGKPRIVLVISGLGLSQTGTQDAINMLPDDVTLAFAPYGSSLQRWVDKARQKGHEVLLQVPMEPENYPDTNPGEHTLLASTDPAGADSDLDWVLGRMTSYTGVMNYMGGRFTSDHDALGNFLVGLNQRGLFYLDDGSSPDSLAKQVGGEVGTPVIAADAIIDLDHDPDKIEHALAKLEVIARTEGLAVGVATAFPSSVAALAAWVPQAAARGLAVVPASAALQR